MKEKLLLKSLLPGYRDILPILQEIREKYNIPEIDPEMDDFNEIFYANDQTDWEAVRQDINTLIRNNPDLIPENLEKLYEGLVHYDKDNPEFEDLEGLLELIPKETYNKIYSVYKFVFSMFQPLVPELDAAYQVYADNIFEILTTGQARDIPQDWFSKVFTMPTLSGEPVVVAMASELADPKEISDQFRFEFTRVFGKDRLNITDGQLNTAEYLRMKLEGKKLRDILDVYIERNPSQFPTDKYSKEYGEAVRKLRERIKKNMDRLEEILDKMIRDKK